MPYKWHAQQAGGAQQLQPGAFSLGGKRAASASFAAPHASARTALLCPEGLYTQAAELQPGVFSLCGMRMAPQPG